MPSPEYVAGFISGVLLTVTAWVLASVITGVWHI